MAAHCSFFRSSTAFPTVRAPYCSADGSALLILSVVNGFSNGSRTVLLGGLQRIARTFARQRLSRRRRAVLLRGWQRIAHTSACQRLSRPFPRRMAQRMASDCSFFRSSMAFAVCPPFCTANGSGFLLLVVVNGFQYGLRAVLLSGWQRIAQRMAADSSFFRSSTAFIVWALFCSPDNRALLILPFVNGCHGLRAVFPNRWQRIARSSTRQRHSRWFACCIAPWMVVDCSYFLSSKAFTTVYAPYFCAHVCGLLIFPLVKGFHGLHAVFLSEWLQIAHSCA